LVYSPTTHSGRSRIDSTMVMHLTCVLLLLFSVLIPYKSSTCKVSAECQEQDELQGLLAFFLGVPICATRDAPRGTPWVESWRYVTF
jgi:hypothetical protein